MSYVEGEVPRDEATVAAAYAERSGRAVDRLDYYQAFGYWKLAVILAGVYARYTAGAYGRGDESWRASADTVVQLADRALEATACAGR
jgi:aminoglycoside phosphotransferase (APT) family kinase protein